MKNKNKKNRSIKKVSTTKSNKGRKPGSYNFSVISLTDLVTKFPTMVNVNIPASEEWLRMYGFAVNPRPLVELLNRRKTKETVAPAPVVVVTGPTVDETSVIGQVVDLNTEND